MQIGSERPMQVPFQAGRQSRTRALAFSVALGGPGSPCEPSVSTRLTKEAECAASATYSGGTTPGSAPADSASTLLYQHADHLTTRTTTDNSGNSSNQQAHYPYGESWYGTGTADPSVQRKFTSYRKETDSSLASGQINYAIARYHGVRIGRFHMADPVRGHVSNRSASTATPTSPEIPSTASTLAASTMMLLQLNWREKRNRTTRTRIICHANTIHMASAVQTSGPGGAVAVVGFLVGAAVEAVASLFSIRASAP